MDNNQGGKFINGFLLGALIGAGVVFLLGTKQGKRIWKAISEDGIGNISNLLDKANKSVDLDEVEDEELDEIVEKPPFAKAPHKAFTSRGKSEERREFAIREKPIQEKPKVKRFFRGISRRVN